MPIPQPQSRRSVRPLISIERVKVPKEREAQSAGRRERPE